MAKRVGPSELPQTVAAFHSLVGLAACGTALGDYAHHMHDPAATADAVRMSAVYLASFIGGATATGSVVAFGKLQVCLFLSVFFLHRGLAMYLSSVFFLGSLGVSL